MNNPWEGNERFEALISGGRTLLDKQRLWTIFSLAGCVRHLPGDVAEFGVYKGGCLRMLARIFARDVMIAFDTFEGIPFSSNEDNHHRQGDFRDTSLESVAEFVDSGNVVYKKGLFSEFLKHDNDMRYKFVHVDCDVYNSVIEACLYFTPRMVPGGIIVFDDYGSPTCLGVRKAINSFYGKRSVKLTTGQAIYIA